MRRRNFSPTAEKRLEIAGQWLYQPLTNRRADDPPGRAALAQVVEHIIRNYRVRSGMMFEANGLADEGIK